MSAEILSFSDSAPAACGERDAAPVRSATSVEDSAPATCLCGATLVRAARGRPRLTCSARCRRVRDVATRKAIRRVAWIALWQACEERGGCSRAEARREIRELRTEIAELLAAAGRRGDER